MELHIIIVQAMPECHIILVGRGGGDGGDEREGDVAEEFGWKLRPRDAGKMLWVVGLCIQAGGIIVKGSVAMKANIIEIRAKIWIRENIHSAH